MNKDKMNRLFSLDLKLKPISKQYGWIEVIIFSIIINMCKNSILKIINCTYYLLRFILRTHIVRELSEINNFKFLVFWVFKWINHLPIFMYRLGFYGSLMHHKIIVNNHLVCITHRYWFFHTFKVIAM